MRLYLKETMLVLLLGAMLPAYAGHMEPVVRDEERGVYILGLGSYNSLGFSWAQTASFFSPAPIRAPAASIGDMWGYTVGAGYRFNSFLHADFRAQVVSTIPFSVSDDGGETALGDINVNTYMLNGYFSYPLPLSNRVEPYVGGGLGFAHSKTSAIYWPLAIQHEFGLKTTRFAWQLSVGSIYRITKRLDFDIHYSYLALGHTSNSGQYDAIASNGVPAAGAPTMLMRVYSNQLGAGLHYRFG